MRAVGSELEVEVLRDAAALHALESRWWALWQRCQWATPFQSPAWLLPWCEHFSGPELFTIALRRGGELVGVAPMALVAEAGERRMVMLGAGLSDYLDAISEAASGAAIAEALWHASLEHSPQWDVMDLQQLRPGSPLLDAPLPVALSDCVQVQDVCPAVPLPPGAASLEQVVPHELAVDVAYYRRRAERLGRVEYARAESAEQARSMLASLIELHAARWQAKGEPGVLSDPRVQAFHRDVVTAMLTAGMLRLYSMRIDGEIAACLYAIAHRDRMYYYLSGFEPALQAIAPGKLIVAHAIEQGCAEGMAWFDMLRGGESYKYAWGAVDQRNYRRFITRALRGRGGRLP